MVNNIYLFFSASEYCPPDVKISMMANNLDFTGHLGVFIRQGKTSYNWNIDKPYKDF